MPQRIQLLDEAIQDMYAAISFAEGDEPDFGKMATVFHPRVRFTRVTPEGVDYFNISEFQAFVMEMLDRGVFTAFYEREFDRRSVLFGDLAHVLSAYEIKAYPNAPTYLARGINSLQMLWEDDSWKVLSIAWDEEGTTERFDFQRIFSKGGVSGEDK